MLPNAIKETAELLRKLPQIGPRQAHRLALFLFRNPDLREEIGKALAGLGDKTKLCETCFRITEESPCTICRNASRDTRILTVVEEDTDLAQIEETGAFKGRYFVLGSRFNPNKGGPQEQGLRIKELKNRITKDADTIKEILLAMNPTVEGELLSQTLRKELAPFCEKHHITLTQLGRGLPTGGEIEYADEETLRQSLAHRG